MTSAQTYFFCGIGGSGMLPLAMIVQARGHRVQGSDRSRDQGRSPDKFAALEAAGFELFPQDGSGVTSPGQIVVASAAVEATVPDIEAALRCGAQIQRRAQLLSALFNDAETSIGVAGTSGKSTTTGMIAWILQSLGRQPTVMNGAVMKNFATADRDFASSLVGTPDLFVSEVDESDGSIAAYNPTLAVVNNIALDHKSMDELRDLFAGYLARAQHCVLNLDNIETAALASGLPSTRRTTYSLNDPAADLLAGQINPTADGVNCSVRASGDPVASALTLQTPGRHNISNALAAIAAVRHLGIPVEAACRALGDFQGIKRRLDVLGTAGGVTVIDDFAHNPDKIAASLATLHETPGRLLILFQPHGFGPLSLMRRELATQFARDLSPEDLLLIPEPVYFGGTTTRSVSSADLAEDIRALGKDAQAFSERELCRARLLQETRPGDRVIVMGARDDTLTDFGLALLRDLDCR